MIRASRLAWRLQRWELATVVIGGVGLAAVAGWQAFDMRSMLVGCGTSSAAPACEFVYPFQETHGGTVGLLQTLMAVAPFAFGLLLGVPIVAREIEHRTALVAWPLARSRTVWLARRVVPVLLIGVAVLALLAVSAEFMDQAYLPRSNLGFLQHEARGVPLVMRGLIVLAMGLTLGALAGRLLPALLLGIALSIGLAIGLGLATDHWVPSQPLEIEEPGLFENPAITDVRYRTPEGQIISAQEGEMIVSAAFEAAAASGEPEPDPSTLPQPVYYGISSARHGEVVLRESLALGATGLALTGAATLIVNRRRPE